MNNLYTELKAEFPNLEFNREVLLANYTTVKIGGPAEVFCETKTSQEFIDLVIYAIKNNIPLTILGWGANTLISDDGIRGLVIKNSGQNIKILKDGGFSNDDTTTNDSNKKPHSDQSLIQPRWHSDKDKGSFKYEFSDLDYDESESPTVVVEIDSGVSLPYAINSLIGQGITGLQWYSRIPATLGGAIYNNIHGGTHFISEVIESVTIIDEKGNLKMISKSELEAGYDVSRFHNTNEIIVSAQLKLYLGDKEKAKTVVQEWAVRKAVQPQKSLGCIFQNISNGQKENLKLPTTSVGYIVEHILNKKNFQIGNAKVSDKHAAFIENIGQATAKDYLEIIKIIIKETKIKTGITLKPEIFFLGFKKRDLEGIIT
ncbi:MAG: hypothetical protein COZ34_01785 [Candidatus Pacebacteria bacterium CG_4_10_14_3_um_filter_34_15]|nr:FAD-binding protein [Candidatus Pacearchaeota archaeon]NCQ65477.1 FAD-binding protein [Candidatus Paceibacterota bacterium]OIO45122.1 MAG: hypothetical protein AUJ41_00675 [Candidatus Pacebacteria bacterium CG1_02_43_31]PIQ81365.1 MAG: hypothetical protein COV78_00525 [Candidatus Pacebacteria bacterium CG11_big_fil_rev_8_21_14_0_20_34_55]PIX81724.1 MAG: hypothetical protein COZ34_01785 [Candidatus Pacebacteria bacterium CG_4_10_14_3_um_filter_34_15]PJC43301.1 MAG: hypothetical protein CO039